jgi:hypothetical protein
VKPTDEARDHSQASQGLAVVSKKRRGSNRLWKGQDAGRRTSS